MDAHRLAATTERSAGRIRAMRQAIGAAVMLVALVGCQGKNVVDAPATLQPPSVQMPGEQSYYPGSNQPSSTGSIAGSNSMWASAPPGPLSVPTSATTSSSIARSRASIDLSPNASPSSTPPLDPANRTSAPLPTSLGAASEPAIRIVEAPASSTRFSQSTSRGMPVNVATLPVSETTTTATAPTTNSTAAAPRNGGTIPFTASPSAGQPGVIEISQLPRAAASQPSAAAPQPRVAPAAIRTRGFLAPPAQEGTQPGATPNGAPGSAPAGQPGTAPSSVPAAPRLSSTGGLEVQPASYEEATSLEASPSATAMPATYATPADGSWSRR